MKNLSKIIFANLITLIFLSTAPAAELPSVDVDLDALTKLEHTDPAKFKREQERLAKLVAQAKNQAKAAKIDAHYKEVLDALIDRRRAILQTKQKQRELRAQIQNQERYEDSFAFKDFLKACFCCPIICCCCLRHVCCDPVDPDDTLLTDEDTPIELPTDLQQ